MKKNEGYVEIVKKRRWINVLSGIIGAFICSFSVISLFFIDFSLFEGFELTFLVVGLFCSTFIGVICLSVAERDFSVTERLTVKGGKKK